jgi:opacity protein-like surface antigen
MSDASGSEITSAEWYMGSISCVLFNRVEPYVKLGMAHMKVKWNEGGADVKMDSQNGFAWSLGSKVLVWNFEKPHLKLVADGFYRVADLDAEGGTCSGSSVPINKANSRFFIREWQIALIAATDIDISTSSTASDFLGVSKLVPYVGMKYSDVSGRLRMTWDSGNYNNPGQIRSRHKFGVVAGCDFIGPNSISFNLEGRFFDETAVTAGLQVLI